MAEIDSIQAEQAVLGSVLIDHGCLRRIGALLREEDFAVELDRAIWRVLTEMDGEGRAIDGLTVAAALKDRGIGKDRENREYLAQLMYITPTSANAEEYAEIVRSTAVRRSVRKALADGLESLDGGASPDDVAALVEQQTQTARQRGAVDLISPKEQMDQFYRYRERLDRGDKPYVSTGFKSLDRRLGGGFLNSGLYFLAGRPGMGKTALAIAIAEYAAQSGRVMFLSMEMTGNQLTARRLAKAARVDSRTLLTDSLTPEEYKRVVEAGSKIESSGLEITDGRSYTTARITSIVRSKPDVRLVIIDHFSLIQVPGKQANHIEYANASKALKAMAKSIQAPVLCLAQLNRQNEERKDKRPQLSDLRETSAAEQDADGVLLLHRPDYYDNGPEVQVGDLTAPSSMDVILAKNRHGPTGRTVLSYYKSTNTFREAYTK